MGKGKRQKQGGIQGQGGKRNSKESALGEASHDELSQTKWCEEEVKGRGMSSGGPGRKGMRVIQEKESEFLMRE